MAEKKNKQQEGEGGGSESKTTPAERAKREAKASRWTLDVCRKAASRFETVEDWAEGFPSSYKAAEARGYLAECTKHMKSRTPAVRPAGKAVAKTPAKKAPAPRKLPKSA